MADALLAVAAGRGRREQISLSLRWCYLSRVFEIFNGSELIVCGEGLVTAMNDSYFEYYRIAH